MAAETGPGDAELVSGCLAGRRDAWDAFVARFSKLVWWSIRKTLARTAFSRRADLHEEIFQDVFRKLLEPDGLSRLRDAKGLRGYLAVVACHAALDRVKALSRLERKNAAGLADEDGEGVEEAVAFLKDGAADPSEAASAKERARLVAAALGALAPKERACVEFHYLDGKTHREIAELLGLPQDTVSTIIRRARQRLKDALTEQGLEA